jgi:hypothetical protein
MSCLAHQHIVALMEGHHAQMSKCPIAGVHCLETSERINTANTKAAIRRWVVASILELASMLGV